MMPGLAAVPVDSTRNKSGLCCPHCELILRDPVQTEDGLRLCRSCFDEIAKMPGYHCKKCDSTVTPEEFYPDRAVQRELALLKVYCKYKDLGCEWQGVLKEWEGHMEGCEFKGVGCPFSGCDRMLRVTDLEQHKLKCSFRPVNCEHCNLQLKFHGLEKHHGICSKYPITCSREGCSKLVAREELPKHQLLECVVEDCLTCEQQVTRSKGVELGGGDTEKIHLSSPLDNFKHHQSLAMAQRELKSELVDIAALAKDKNRNIDHLQQLRREDKEVLNNKIMELRSQVEALRKRVNREAEPQTVDGNLAARVKFLEQEASSNQQTIKNQRKEIGELKAELVAFKREYHQQQQKGSLGGHGSRHTGLAGRESGGSEASDTRVLQIERRLEEVARQANSAHVQVQEVELQLQASLASTYNGGFLWRIPDISRRRRDAVEERVVSLYSPPFYTARNGYKMCIRAYLNGDGMGYKTHFSLFFVLMKGEFDALLKWPFDHKISMILVDQDHKKHIVQTFKPTVDSNSFQRPKSDMNVASGCPQFEKLSVLDKENYVRDDVLFIKCIVDTSRIFHP